MIGIIKKDESDRPDIIALFTNIKIMCRLLEVNNELNKQNSVRQMTNTDKYVGIPFLEHVLEK